MEPIRLALISKNGLSKIIEKFAAAWLPNVAIKAQRHEISEHDFIGLRTVFEIMAELSVEDQRECLAKTHPQPRRILMAQLENLLWFCDKQVESGSHHIRIPAVIPTLLTTSIADLENMQTNERIVELPNDPAQN